MGVLQSDTRVARADKGVLASDGIPPTGKPTAPTGVNAVAGVGSITISWNAVAGVSSYNLYWSKTSGVTPSTGSAITGVTSPYLHSSLTPGTAYYYTVVAGVCLLQCVNSAQNPIQEAGLLRWDAFSRGAPGWGRLESIQQLLQVFGGELAE